MLCIHVQMVRIVDIYCEEALREELCTNETVIANG